ncbi:hypothetical protein JAAARDRAFT_42807 [Jaapia argillacea MUCL 33604]|uniref:Uncharacterized protein n=1 Tax=Jaapia argillacea MUCL 33604 TaxID=933084 RepID=A0A067PER5_9AGAM|nr:hypothetical protein JAAARDRAFT_42807 [Jaapia argillacea MUCL 33604]
MSTCSDIHHCRTMVGIISSCITTIFACTWVAIHPNIPAPYETSLEITVRRMRVTVMALIAPELVIVWAMRQWVVAGQIAKKYKDRKWTRTHGFFVQMGGFVLVDDKGKLVRILDLDELEKLDDNEFPQITEAEIQDKSKRDALSKAVIMVQTAWFILQCIARLFEHLPITEIEVVTLAFTVLNLLTYTLWWSKPADVRFPHCVRKNRGPKIASSREETREDDEGENEGDNVSKGENNGLDGEGTGSKGEEAGLRGEGASSNGDHEVRLEEFGPKKGGDDDQRDDGFLDAIDRIFSEMRHWWIEEIWTGVEGQSPFLIIFALPLIAILRIIELFSAMLGYGEGIAKDAKRVPTFYAGDLTGSEITQLFLISSFIATVFGAIHCLAWHVQVPSPTQLLLWRVSSLTITILPVLEVFAYKSPDSFLLLLAILLALLGAIAYIVARITLLVLAFKSLRSIPPGAYETVVWTTFIPHI